MNLKLKNETLKRLSVEEFRQSEKNSIVVVLDNIRSLNNVGSVFRTCDAFLIQNIMLCGVTGTPPNKEIEKTALGATQTVSWEHHSDTLTAISVLRQKQFKIYAVEQAEKSLPLHSFTMPENPIALIFGNEVYGVEQQVINVCDGVIEIPQLGTKHSLNVSVSAGIVLWEILRSQL